VSNFSKYPPFFLRKKKCKDSGIGWDLTVFAKIHTSQSLQFFIFLKNMDILRISLRFNRKS
jgi:hypothetical protein